MTNDLSQCGNCIYHYTYNGQDMCKQVGDDFYLQWKVENCPHHTTITRATAISDEIYELLGKILSLEAENATLHKKLDKVLDVASQTYLDLCGNCCREEEEPCVDGGNCYQCFKEYCLKQVEKELAEEGKDD